MQKKKKQNADDIKILYEATTENSAWIRETFYERSLIY